VASFVANTEPNFEGIFAIPSNMIRGDQQASGATSLSSWPVCSLPAAPGQMLLLIDPPDDNGSLRARCDADYLPPASGSGNKVHGDLQADAAASGHPGVYKLAVSLPEKGGVAIIDAQALLDQDGGAFASCPIERWLPLSVKLPPAAPNAPADDQGGACAEDEEIGLPEVQSAAPAPSDLVSSAGTLFVADSAAPVIHRIAVNDPCAPTVLDPLLPSSTQTPSRIVTTSQLAVSPLTLGLKRYLYALDARDGSLMVFDVSDDSTIRTPLTRPLDDDPFGAADRIRFQAPVRQVVIVEHQNDEADATTGGTLPVLCDADPDSTGPGTVYQTADGYDAGAGPQKLRGVFAFAVLTSGDVVVIDVEDYDAPCRGPANQSAALGCDNGGQGLATSDEYSCRAIVPHRVRSAAYLLFREDIVNNQPGVSALPILFDAEGTLLNRDESNPFGEPSIRATVSPDAPDNFNLTVGSDLQALDPATGLILSISGSTDATKNALAFNLAEPRAQLLDQAWTITYEGRLPGFSGRFAQFTSTAAGFDLRDTTAGFCSRGVISQTALVERLVHEGAAVDAAIDEAAPVADYAQIMSASPVENDDYWSKQGSCSFLSCKQTFGTIDAPLATRDLRIVEAGDGALSLEHRSPAGEDAASLSCCFPGVAKYAIRPGSQWTALGSAVGFLHNVRADDRGVCRPRCDTSTAALRGRVTETPIALGAAGEPVLDGSATAFRNPMFRFAILSRGSTRDMQFRFSTQGAFRPLTISVLTSTDSVQPQDVVYLPNTGELVVSDGTRDGITLLDLDLLQVSRQYN
jgi:hypothetical protein